MNSVKEHGTGTHVACGFEAPAKAMTDLNEQLQILCKTRADKLRAVAFLLQGLLRGKPTVAEWALTDPDGKVYAYVTLAAEWQRRHITPSRAKELAQRSRSVAVTT
jgi:hypothetical protein